MSPSSNYTQGYSQATTSSHASRTVETDAAFLVPHIKPGDRVLDIGCGPGTITVGLASMVPEGSVVGVDISPEIVAQAQAAFAPLHGETRNLSFRQADLLAGLPFDDDTFDIVFSSQLFPHLSTAGLKLKALAEMRRVTRPGGLLATRDAAELHFYPRSYNLDTLWAGNMGKALGQVEEGEGGFPGGFPGGQMPALFRQAGFAPDMIKVQAGTTVHSGGEARRWFSQGSRGRLDASDPYRQSWRRAGIAEREIEEARDSLQRWAEDEDAWYVALQAEIVGTK